MVSSKKQIVIAKGIDKLSKKLSTKSLEKVIKNLAKVSKKKKSKRRLRKTKVDHGILRPAPRQYRPRLKRKVVKRN
jgi:predicted metallo-beta-lactamase superfamily hydrolase